MTKNESASVSPTIDAPVETSPAGVEKAAAVPAPQPTRIHLAMSIRSRVITEVEELAAQVAKRFAKADFIPSTQTDEWMDRHIEHALLTHAAGMTVGAIDPLQISTIRDAWAAEYAVARKRARNV